MSHSDLNQLWRRMYGKPAPGCVTLELYRKSLQEALDAVPLGSDHGVRKDPVSSSNELLRNLDKRLRANIPEAFLPTPRPTIRAYIARLSDSIHESSARAIFAYDARDAVVQARFECKRYIPRKRLVDIGPPITDDDWLLLRHDMRPQAVRWRELNRDWILAEGGSP